MRYGMNQKKTPARPAHTKSLRGGVVWFGRLLAILTTAAVALSTTAAGLLVWWYATQSPVAVPSLAHVDAQIFLVVYGLLMVCPWWALLAVLFYKLNWLERQGPARHQGKQARQANHTRQTEQPRQSEVRHAKPAAG